MIKLLLSMFITIFLCTSTSAFALDDSAIKIQWGYKGNISPEKWGQLAPQFALCASGKSQSPINISKKVHEAKNTLEINYQPASMIIMDDGATDLTIKKEKTVINTGHGIQLNFPGSAEKIRFNGKEYHLIQFHFHSPSENMLHGQAYPMDIHFVHQSNDGEIAVIGVFVKGGSENSNLRKIVANLPPEEGKEYPIAREKINPADLLPTKKDYYSFTGSLTTPPCVEGIQWIVMPEVINASPAQIAQLRKAAGGANARPVQPLNKRRVYYTTIE